MADYRLRSIPDALFRRVRDRARREERELRDVLIDLLAAYADETDLASVRRRGGVARSAALSPDRRSEIARTAAQARWRDRPDKPH